MSGPLELLAGRCEGDSWPPHDHAMADDPFECGDLQRQGRLGHAQPPGRPPEVQFFRQDEKRSQPTEVEAIHKFTLSEIRYSLIGLIIARVPKIALMRVRRVRVSRLRTGMCVAMTALLVSSLPAWASALVVGPLGAQLDAYFARLEAFGFSGAVLVEKEGEVVLSNGYGYADLDRHIAVTPATAFEVASITKTFTASAIVKLAERGDLALSDSLGRFFAETPADKRGIRLAQLLSHSSGIRGPEEANGAVVGDITRQAWLARVFATPLAFPPGTDNEYSNSGFSVLAAVIEVVSREPYEEFVRHHLLEPAGMRQTTFRGSPAPAGIQVARGYGD